MVGEDLSRFVAASDICTKSKHDNRLPASLLRPLPVLCSPWSHISLDFITGLPQSYGSTCIMTIIDRFFKAVHLVSLSNLPSTKETEQLHVFWLHGLSTDIILERGPPHIQALEVSLQCMTTWYAVS